jgi:dihydroxyacetone kinase-like predicted kinase
MALIRRMIETKGDDACTVTLYFGEDQTQENAEMIAETMEDEYKDAEFVVLKGGQPLYYYYIAVQ